MSHEELHIKHLFNQNKCFCLFPNKLLFIYLINYEVNCYLKTFCFTSQKTEAFQTNNVFNTKSANIGSIPNVTFPIFLSRVEMYLNK